MNRRLLLQHTPPEARGGEWVTSVRLLDENERGGDRRLVGAFEMAVMGPAALRGGASPFFPIALIVAMRLGLPLRVEGVLPPRWRRSMVRFQEVTRRWFGERFHVVPFEAEFADAPLAADPDTRAAFFSCGVDSFHAALRPDTTHLLYVDGFDLPLHETVHRRRAEDGARRAAKMLGMPLWRVSTNARLLLDTHAKHGEIGAVVLGAAARLMTGSLGGVTVGGSYRWDTPFKGSDHFLLIDCFSADDLPVASDGIHLERLDKIRAIGSHPAVQSHLRVCWNPENTPVGVSSPNCRQCEKCCRTRLQFAILGFDGLVKTLPPLDDDVYQALEGIRSDSALFWKLAAEHLAKHDPDSPVLARLLPKIRQWRADDWSEALWRLGKGSTSHSHWPALARRLLKPLLATIQPDDPKQSSWLRRRTREALHTTGGRIR